MRAGTCRELEEVEKWYYTKRKPIYVEREDYTIYSTYTEMGLAERGDKQREGIVLRGDYQIMGLLLKGA